MSPRRDFTTSLIYPNSEIKLTFFGNSLQDRSSFIGFKEALGLNFRQFLPHSVVDRIRDQRQPAPSSVRHSLVAASRYHVIGASDLRKCPKHFHLLINFLCSAPSCFYQNTRIRKTYVCCDFHIPLPT